MEQVHPAIHGYTTSALACRIQIYSSTSYLFGSNTQGKVTLSADICGLISLRAFLVVRDVPRDYDGRHILKSRCSIVAKWVRDSISHEVSRSRNHIIFVWPRCHRRDRQVALHHHTHYGVSAIVKQKALILFKSAYPNNMSTDLHS